MASSHRPIVFSYSQNSDLPIFLIFLGNKTSTNTAWYLNSFWALFVLYEAQSHNKVGYANTYNVRQTRHLTVSILDSYFGLHVFVSSTLEIV